MKDFRYSLREFIGSDWAPVASDAQLYQIILYLAPGDYHGYHAPDSMVLKERRHFAGLLLPVAPWMLAVAPKLFEANERVVLMGKQLENEKL